MDVDPLTVAELLMSGTSLALGGASLGLQLHDRRPSSVTVHPEPAMVFAGAGATSISLTSTAVGTVTLGQ